MQSHTGLTMETVHQIMQRGFLLYLLQGKKVLGNQKNTVYMHGMLVLLGVLFTIVLSQGLHLVQTYVRTW